MTTLKSPRVAVIGGGPAGLMAAEAAAAAGATVDLFEAKASVGRKFLVAGKGGLNLTHSDPFERFAAHYGARADAVAQWLRGFDANAVRHWAQALGVATFIGSSGRVFPEDLKAAPLLRAWLRRLRASGVAFHVRHRWRGWNDDGRMRFETPAGDTQFAADAVVLALGGGSWPQLGSDAAWVPWLEAHGIDVAPLTPSNCGFDIAWSAHFAQRHAGAPLKRVAASLHDRQGLERRQLGECVVTASGIEGQLVYALSGPLRDAIAAAGSTTLTLDLLPQRSADSLLAALSRPRGSRSHSEHWRRVAGVDAVRAGLVYEALGQGGVADVQAVARTLKALPLRLIRPRPIEEAISSAGGVAFEAMDEHLMLRALPGVFCAGEMVDWEAPTGGYLLTACLAAGRLAGAAAAGWARDGHTQPHALAQRGFAAGSSEPAGD